MTKDFEKKRKDTARRLGIAPEKIPRRIAIIMDGNGRWAQNRGQPRIIGHQQGGKTVQKIALDCVAVGVESLILYSFSSENWKRPKEEIAGLMKLYRQYLVGIRPLLKKNNVKLLHLGRLEGLPENVVEELDKTQQLTAGHTGMKLGLALNYGGRNEIIDACKKIASKCKSGEMEVDDIDRDTFAGHLYRPQMTELDLLIRTAGERRVSNFLLWQISYSEFYVTDVFWPDFDKTDLEEAIKDYAYRQRRFGDVKSSG